MKKPTIRKPTHHLIADGVVYADIRCGDWKPAIRLRSTGETQRPYSPMLDCDLMMGRWHAGVRYCFGLEADHIPDHAIMVPVKG